MGRSLLGVLATCGRLGLIIGLGALIGIPFESIRAPSALAAETAPVPGERLLGMTKVVPLHLTLSAAQFDALTPVASGPPGSGQAGGGPAGRPGFGPPPPPPDGTHQNTFGVNFPWSAGDLTWEGETFGQVGLRYKGNYTYLATARALKKPLKIDFNRHVPEQQLAGLTMVNLHTGVSDPTRAREILSYAFFRDAGVPAPRTAIAELTLTVPNRYDREYVGAYTLVEQVNKGFLRQHFGDGSGMLLKPEGLQGGPVYLGEKWRIYEDRYDPEDKPTREQKQRLIDFTHLISTSSDDEFAARIGDFLDCDAFLRFIAANALLANLDSYLGYGHNYYLYLVPATNRFVFIPWDLDLSLATWPAAGTPEQLVELSIRHPHAGPNRLLDRVLGIPTHRERYLAIIRELTATCFQSAPLLAQLDAIEQALREPLARERQAVAARREGGRGAGPAMAFGGQFGQSLPPRKFIEKRTQSVAAQLAGQTSGFEPRSFGGGGGGGGGMGGGFGRPPAATPARER